MAQCLMVIRFNRGRDWPHSTPKHSKMRIWTIGHSTLAPEIFLKLLQGAGVAAVADVRRYPFSPRYPHFNRDQLAQLLQHEGLEYRHYENLGGRRPPLKPSPSTAWRKDSFRGYADYLTTPAFAAAFEELQDYAREQAVALMCAESLWWRCHRSILADLLKHAGWEVWHLMSDGKQQLHPYTSAARLVGGRLSYCLEEGISARPDVDENEPE